MDAPGRGEAGKKEKSRRDRVRVSDRGCRPRCARSHRAAPAQWRRSRWWCGGATCGEQLPIIGQVVNATFGRSPPLAGQLPGNTQGLGLHWIPPMLRDFVCCCMIGASAPGVWQFTCPCPSRWPTSWLMSICRYANIWSAPYVVEPCAQRNALIMTRSVEAESQLTLSTVVSRSDLAHHTPVVPGLASVMT